MRPLASPVTEYRLMGVVELLGGAALAVAAVGSEGPMVAGVTVLFAAAFFGGWMYLLAYRRFVRQAVQDPAPAPTAEREGPGRTTWRMLSTTGALLGVMTLVAAVADAFGLVAGIALGNGASLWLTSRWLARWEARTGRRLLREPRWRWSRRGRSGWGRGRGIMDPQDFYVDPVPAT